MYKILYKKINEKFEEKFYGLEDEYLRNVAIVPVIWCDDGLRPLKQFRGGLEKFIADYKNQIFPPYALVYIKEKKRFYFETVSSFFRK